MACTREAVEDPCAIGVGLKATDAPDAGVRERAVIEVHRVLRRDHDAHAERARLLHQRDDGALRWWVCRMRREKAVHFVKDDECLQALGTGEAPNPRQDFLEQHPENE